MTQNVIRVKPQDIDADSIPNGVVGFIDAEGFPRPWNPAEEFPDYLLMQGCAAYLNKEEFSRAADEALAEMDRRSLSFVSAPEGADAHAPAAPTTARKPRA